MKKLACTLFNGLALLVMVSQAVGGSWTANKFSYKPSLGARGEQEKSLYDQGVDQLDARLGKEIWVGDPNYGSTIQDAIATIGGSPVTLRVPPGTYTISTNFAIPSNVALRVEKGGTLVVADGVTLTINGPFEAGLYRVFSCSGTGRVVFGAGAVQEVYSEWWGSNTTPGTTDMTSALQDAINTNMPLRLIATTYLTGDLTLPNSYVIKGPGWEKAILSAKSGTNKIITLSAGWGTLEGFSLEGNNVANYGIFAAGSAQEWTFINIWVRDVKGTPGIGYANADNDFAQRFYNCRFTSNNIGTRIIKRAHQNYFFGCVWHSNASNNIVIGDGSQAVFASGFVNCYSEYGTTTGPLSEILINSSQVCFFNLYSETAYLGQRALEITGAGSTVEIHGGYSTGKGAGAAGQAEYFMKFSGTGTLVVDSLTWINYLTGFAEGENPNAAKVVTYLNTPLSGHARNNFGNWAEVYDASPSNPNSTFDIAVPTSRFRIKNQYNYLTINDVTNSQDLMTFLKKTDITSGKTGILLVYHNGTGITIQQVTLGSADSGGTGYKVLRVPN